MRHFRGFEFATAENAENFATVIRLTGFVTFAGIPSIAHRVEVETYRTAEVLRLARASAGFLSWYKI